MHIPLVTLVVVLLFPQLPDSVGQEKGAPPSQPAPTGPAPRTWTPTSQEANPVQPSAVPPPTVVLKPGETPGITFKEPVYDFGRVPVGTEVTCDFVFTNTGNGPLEILLVKPSCGCTTAGAYERIVPPGQTGKLPFKLSTKGSSGRMSKPVTIHTNAPAPGATVTLTIQGDVWEPIAAEPRIASFGRLTTEAARAPGLVTKVTLINNTSQPANLTDVHSTSRLFGVQPPAVIEPGKKFELTIAVTMPLPPGNINGAIELSTGIAEAPTLSIPISAHVLADVEATPSGILLAPDRPALQQRQVLVQNNTSNPVKLRDLRVSNPALKVTLQETQPGLRYTLTVDIPADFVPPPAGETITLKTDCPSVPEMVIPVRAIRGLTTHPSPPAPAANPPPPPAAGTRTSVNDTSSSAWPRGLARATPVVN
jgi:hypothetical protein